MNMKENIINGHEYVDLGLNVLWATCNVGAEKTWGHGDYYAWGETETKNCYSLCETWAKNVDDIGGTWRDVAHVKWGGRWRMPTATECNELIENCISKWMTGKLMGQHSYTDWSWMGRMFINEANGNSIFLPAIGYKDDYSAFDFTRNGYYWSTDPCRDDDVKAFGLFLDRQYSICHPILRSYGCLVRPVADKLV